MKDTPVSKTIDTSPRLVQMGGKKLTTSKAVFTANSKYICCCSGNAVKVISVVSGECVRELVGHRKGVTCVRTNPHNLLQVLTSSRDGTVKRWDYQDGVVLKTYRVKRRLTVFYPLSTTPDTLIALAESTVLKIQLTDNAKEPTVIIKGRDIIDSNKALSVGANDTVVAVIEKHALICYSLTTAQKQCHTLTHSTRAYFTCVQCHPTEPCVSTGSSTGKIHVWWNVFDCKVVMAIHHWHHCAVNDLLYTTEGSYLLSGGDECVLVKWQLNNEDKNFLPRLEAPINYIAGSPDNTTYAITHADNGIQFVSSNFELLSQYQGLTRAFLTSYTQGPLPTGLLVNPTPGPVPTGLLVDPTTGSLVLSGRPGHLQFYDLTNDKQLYNLDITCETYVVADAIDGPVCATEVTRAAFDVHGEVLATVEMWDDAVMSPEIRLKFWHDIDGDGSFSLNTCVELPHNKPINSIQFRPTVTSIRDSGQLNAMLVTTSNDGRFKLWALVDDTDIHRSNIKWECESVGFYRDQPVTTATFSTDGSLLAAAFGSSVTLWDPDTNAMKATLTHSHGGDVRLVVFGRESCSHLLVSATPSHLSVWSILTCSDPRSDIVAAIATDQTLHVFRPSSPTQLYTHHNIGDITAAIFVPRADESCRDDDALPWQQTSQLYLMTRDQDLFVLSTRDETVKSAQYLGVEEANMPTAPMSLFIAEGKRSAVVEPSKMADIPSTVIGQSQDDFFTSASHVLPPPSQLCRHFIERHLDLNTQMDKMSIKDDDDEEKSETTLPQPDSDSDIEMKEKEVTIQNDTAVTQTVTKKDLKAIRKIKKLNFDWLEIKK